MGASSAKNTTDFHHRIQVLFLNEYPLLSLVYAFVNFQSLEIVVLILSQFYHYFIGENLLSYSPLRTTRADFNARRF